MITTLHGCRTSREQKGGVTRMAAYQKIDSLARKPRSSLPTHEPQGRHVEGRPGVSYSACKPRLLGANAGQLDHHDHGGCRSQRQKRA
jgi:hypothetical protein